MRDRSIAGALLLAALLTTGQVAQTQPPVQPPKTVLEFIADDNWKWDASIVDKAFVCLVTNGQDEGCFGFHSTAAGKMTIYGPGCKTPGGPDCTLPRATSTPTTHHASADIDATMKQAILDLGAKTHGKELTLGRCDCAAFGNRVVKAAGLKAPSMTKATTPAVYLKALAELNPQKVTLH
ncbi:MAG: hypothetical protein M3O15_12080 [Acidobacteriota bacterium]|nr:hypothetical protein [Acidobacteriota bacterium]